MLSKLTDLSQSQELDVIFSLEIRLKKALSTTFFIICVTLLFSENRYSFVS